MRIPVLILVLVLVLVLVLSCSPGVDPGRLSGLEDRVAAELTRRIGTGDLFRDDGYLYAVDLGQALTYLAGTRRFFPARAVRERLVKDFLLRDESDPYTDGFVAWRVGRNGERDASGTTEALRVAEGLLDLTLADPRPEDHGIVPRILSGYARHAAVDRGVWFVRNYFNLGTRAFSVNSFLVDYDPDFLARAAAHFEDEELAEVARRSTELVGSAGTPCGLLYDIIQPEVSTLMPDWPHPVFSPNDRVQLSNAATVAERSVRQAPEVARRVLAFALDRLPDLRLAYYGRTGEAATEWRAGVETDAVLVRLAARLDDEAAVRRLLPRFLDGVERFIETPEDPVVYRAGEILGTFRVLREGGGEIEQRLQQEQEQQRRKRQQ